MALSFFSPSRTVLLVADEALYVFSASARGVRLVETVPWGAESFTQNVSHIISRVCKGKPVLILNDMVEQHYRKERVLKAGVSLMDRGSMIKRKLNVAFPNYPIRAALPLKEKLPNVDKKKAADIYIFTAIPASAQFQSTINAVVQSLASVSGFCLLPVESSDMVKTLSSKIGGKGKKSAWTIFIGQHRNGGLRQVVTKNGELALTRMTPITDDDSDPHEWAGEVHQEFKATMSYLSRFGYQTEDGLDIILISNPESGDAVEALIEEECNFRSMNALEAARMLGMAIGAQDDLRYADTLHVGWAGRKTRFILPMDAQQITRVSKPRKVAVAASFLLVCSAAFLGYKSFSAFSGISQVNSDLKIAQEKFVQLDAQYKREVAAREAQGFEDIELVQNSIKVYQAIQKQDMNTLKLFQQVGEALGSDLNLDRITVTKAEEGVIKDALAGLENDNEARIFTATMQLTYPSNADPVKGNQEILGLEARLQQRLEGYEVKATKLLQDYEYSESFVVSEDNAGDAKVNQDFVAEITIQGPKIND